MFTSCRDADCQGSRKSFGFIFRIVENRILQIICSVLKAFHQSFGPHKFSGQNGKSPYNGSQAGTWSHKHDAPDQNDSKTDYNFNKTFGLLDGRDYGVFFFIFMNHYLLIMVLTVIARGQLLCNLQITQIRLHVTTI